MEPYGNSQSNQTRNDSAKSKSYAIKLTGVSHGKKQHFSQTISKSKLKNVPKNDTTFSHASKKQTNFTAPITKLKSTPSNSNNLGR